MSTMSLLKEFVFLVIVGQVSLQRLWTRS
jgi:hypothetical protein